MDVPPAPDAWLLIPVAVQDCWALLLCTVYICIQYNPVGHAETFRGEWVGWLKLFWGILGRDKKAMTCSHLCVNIFDGHYSYAALIVGCIPGIVASNPLGYFIRIPSICIYVCSTIIIIIYYQYYAYYFQDTYTYKYVDILGSSALSRVYQQAIIRGTTWSQGLGF